MKSFSIVLFVIFSLVANGQNMTRQHILEMSKSLGFVYRNDLELQSILKQHPILKGKVNLLLNDFNLAHGNAANIIEDKVSQYLEVPKLEFKKLAIEESTKTFGEPVISYDEALEYLNNYSSNVIHGKDYDNQSYVSTLLLYNPRFRKDPVLEFNEGFINLTNINLDNNLRLSLETPMSWEINQGKHPNVRNTFSSYKGLCTLTLLVKSFYGFESESEIEKLELEQFYKSKKYEDIIDEILNEEYGETYLNEILENIKSSQIDNVTMDGEKALHILAFGNLKNQDPSEYFFVNNFITIYEGYIINLSFVTRSESKSIRDTALKFNSLCQQIVRSLIIKNKWE